MTLPFLPDKPDLPIVGSFIPTPPKHNPRDEVDGERFRQELKQQQQFKTDTEQKNKRKQEHYEEEATKPVEKNREEDKPQEKHTSLFAIEVPKNTRPIPLTKNVATKPSARSPILFLPSEESSVKEEFLSHVEQNEEQQEHSVEPPPQIIESSLSPVIVQQPEPKKEIPQEPIHTSTPQPPSSPVSEKPALPTEKKEIQEEPLTVEPPLPSLEKEEPPALSPVPSTPQPPEQMKEKAPPQKKPDLVAKDLPPVTETTTTEQSPPLEPTLKEPSKQPQQTSTKRTPDPIPPALAEPPPLPPVLEKKQPPPPIPPTPQQASATSAPKPKQAIESTPPPIQSPATPKIQPSEPKAPPEKTNLEQPSQEPVKKELKKPELPTTEELPLPTTVPLPPTNRQETEGKRKQDKESSPSLEESSSIASLAETDSDSQQGSQEEKEEEDSPPPPLMMHPLAFSSILEKTAAPRPTVGILPTEILKIFERMSSVISILDARKGMTETTFILQDPKFSSIFLGSKITIKAFASAPHTYNICLSGSEAARDAFDKHKEELMKAFKEGNFSFTIHSIETTLQS